MQWESLKGKEWQTMVPSVLCTAFTWSLSGRDLHFIPILLIRQGQTTTLEHYLPCPASGTHIPHISSEKAKGMYGDIQQMFGGQLTSLAPSVATPIQTLL